MPSRILASETNHIDRRVKAGVAWLDSRDPSWREKIKRPALDVSQPNRCILSQVFGAWIDVPLTRIRYIELGFLAPDGLTGFQGQAFDMRDAYYRFLTSKWLEVI